MGSGSYNSGMRSIFVFAALCGLVVTGRTVAGEKHAPLAQGENDDVSITATLLTPEQVAQVAGAGSGNQFAVLDVKVTPKSGKEIGIHLDDFLLRSESSGDHSGPLVASQIAGDGALVVSRKYGSRSNPEMPQILESTKVEMKGGSGGDKGATGGENALEALKKAILAEKTIVAPESGLLFFPLQKEKAKNLVFYYNGSQAKIRMQFK